MRNEAVRFISYSIKADSGFKFWFDPWLSNVPLVHQFGEGIVSVMDSSPNVTVGSMILDGQWNVSSSNDYRAIQIRHMLNDFAIGSKDAVLWNNELNVKMGVIWDSFRRRGVSFPWLPLIWNKLMIPSCSFITWLACRDRLSTKDRVNLFLYDMDPTCVLCRSCPESAEHLFSACPYTYLLLRASPFKLTVNWNDWQQGMFFQDALSSFFKEMGYLFITVLIY